MNEDEHGEDKVLYSKVANWPLYYHIYFILQGIGHLNNQRVGKAVTLGIQWNTFQWDHIIPLSLNIYLGGPLQSYWQ